MRPPDPEDDVELYLVVNVKATGLPVADLAPAGESVTVSARTAAQLLRSVADDLERTPARPPARRR